LLTYFVYFITSDEFLKPTVIFFRSPEEPEERIKNQEARISESLAGDRLSTVRDNPFSAGISIRVHPETPDGHSSVFDLETRSFSSCQGNQELAVRRTSVSRTSRSAD